MTFDRGIVAALFGESDGRTAMPPPARRLAVATGVMLGAVLPMLMVIANKSAPASLAATALCANLSAYMAGYGNVLWRRYAALLIDRMTGIVLAFLVICLCSLGWSIDPALSRRGLIEALPELVFAVMIAAAWPLVAVRRDFLWLLVGIVGSAVLIAFEHTSGMSLHVLVRARGEAWDLKRSAIPPVLMIWPALALCVSRAKPFIALGLLAAAFTGIVVSHSGAPGFALIAAIGFGLLAFVVPRTATVVTALIVAALIVSAPWTGSLAARFISPKVESILAEEHAAHRMRIWLAFEDRIGDRWAQGYGFDASFKVSQAPRPDGKVEGADNPDMLNNHPHNIFLELWVELGLIGSIAVAGLFAAIFLRLGAMRAQALAPRLAFMVAIVGVGLVGLSAWQPWWLATIAAALLWFDILAIQFDA